VWDQLRDQGIPPTAEISQQRFKRENTQERNLECFICFITSTSHLYNPCCEMIQLHFSQRSFNIPPHKSSRRRLPPPRASSTLPRLRSIRTQLQHLHTSSPPLYCPTPTPNEQRPFSPQKETLHHASSPLAVESIECSAPLLKRHDDVHGTEVLRLACSL
jgi:hypothetical protein